MSGFEGDSTWRNKAECPRRTSCDPQDHKLALWRVRVVNMVVSAVIRFVVEDPCNEEQCELPEWRMDVEQVLPTLVLVDEVPEVMLIEHNASRFLQPPEARGNGDQKECQRNPRELPPLKEELLLCLELPTVEQRFCVIIKGRRSFCNNIPVISANAAIVWPAGASRSPATLALPDASRPSPTATNGLNRKRIHSTGRRRRQNSTDD